MIQPAKLRVLLDKAEAGGVDAGLLRDASDELVELCLRAAALERLVDPRRLRTADLARRVAKANKTLARNGQRTGRVAILAERFGLSRSRIHALLALSCEPQDSNVF